MASPRTILTCWSRSCPGRARRPGLLFFFEAGFFLLAVVALALAEIWSRSLALWLWAAVTAISFAVCPLVNARLARTPAGDRTEVRWRQTVADSWQHLNKLLLIGLAALAGWWWLGQ